MIYLGADHRGFELKNQILDWFVAKNLVYTDLGNTDYDPYDDYIDFAIIVARAVTQNVNYRGILICGSGQGMCIGANKVPGIRAGICNTVNEVNLARSHNDINILCLSADQLQLQEAQSIIEVFFNTLVSDEDRHQRRLEKIRQLEQEICQTR